MKKKIVKPLPQKEVKKKQNEVMVWMLAVMMILWTVASVLGVIGFARTCEDKEESGGIVRASAETAVDNSTADGIVRPIAKAYDPSQKKYTFEMDILNSLTWTNEENQVNSFAVNFSFVSINGHRSILYDDIVIDLLTSTVNDAYNIPFINLADGDDSTDDFGFYALNAPYSSPNAEPITSFPRAEDFYPHSYSLDYVDYGNGLGGVTFQFTIREKSFTTGEFYIYYIVFDTYVVESRSIYITSRSFDVLSGDCPFYVIDGLDYSYATINDLAYSNGYNAGESAGYQRGYSYGYDIGKADGFSQGVADANEYSFAGFFGTIFDVPVQTFLSITNFEILGVNIGGFLLALLTILMILAVVKLIF